MAAAMPLVHYPASSLISSWVEWGGLSCSMARGQPPAQPGPFGELRHRHVFAYAGPSCYYRPDCIGDAVLYFWPEAEQACEGSASPFDSGSLEDDPPRLQPFRSRNADEAERWAFFTEHAVALRGWREAFATWLGQAYDQPLRYLDSGPDRYAAGEPDRTTPAELLEHNGTRGRAMYDVCGDRRAWTWEIRVEGRLPFTHVAALSVAFDSFEVASDFADEHGAREGRRPRVDVLPADVNDLAQSLYERSGAILRELIGS